MGSAVQAAFGNSYPADPRSGAGVRFVKLSLAYRVQLDYTNVAFSSVAPTTGLLVAQNVDGSFTAFDISALPISPQFIASLMSGPIPPGYAPRRGQFLQALRASGADRVATVRATIPSDPNDPLAIAWQDTIFVSAGSLIAQHVKTVLGFSNDDLNTLLNAARTISE